MKEKKILAFERPALLKEWDYNRNYPLTPDNVKPFTHKKIWWICPNNHGYQASVSYRTSNANNPAKGNCPICSGKLIISSKNDLKTLFPTICEEWNYYLNDSLGIHPKNTAPHSDKVVWWTCHICGNSWKSKIDTRTRNGTGCPKCGKNKSSASRFLPVRCIETNMEYSSITKAAKATSLSRNSISICCKDMSKPVKGFH